MNKQRAEKRAKRFWVSLVVSLLGLQLAIGGFAVSMATSEKAPVVLPDYHQAALNWDETKQRREAIDTLGWSIDFEPSEVVDESGNRAVQLTMVDRVGEGIDGLKVAANAYPHARARREVSFVFSPLGSGKYQAVQPLSRAGLWRLELSIEHDGVPMSIIRTMELK
ncbi:MAG: FixH family protein [Rubripirellula sp.]